jgi:hypothetical protein
MSTLRAIQADFQAYILSSDGDAQAAQLIGAHVYAQVGLSTDARLAIYHDAYRIRLREALCEAYDKTWTLIGDELFHDLAARYTASHPSTFRNLRWFGDRFAACCAQTLPDYPFVAELAELEWSLGLAFDAADATPASAASLAGVAPDAWGTLQFYLHPSVRVLEQHWNTAALWQALKDDVTPPASQALPAPLPTLVWRNGLRPHFRALDALEHAALAGIAAGDNFGAICEAALATDAEAMPRMAGFLQSWLASGVLTLAPPSAQVCG